MKGSQENTAAFTPGCTIEAHEFAEATGKFQALGASVIGVSQDDIATLEVLSTAECRSKFPVAADEDGSIIKSYGAAMMGCFPMPTARRISF